MTETMTSYPFLPSPLGHKRLAPDYQQQQGSGDSSWSDSDGDIYEPERKRRISAALAKQLAALRIQKEATSNSVLKAEDKGVFVASEGFTGIRNAYGRSVSNLGTGMGKEVGEALDEVETEMEMDSDTTGRTPESIVKSSRAGKSRGAATIGDDIVTLDLTMGEERAKDWALIKRPIDSRAVVVYRSPLESLLGVKDRQNGNGQTLVTKIDAEEGKEQEPKIINNSLFDATFFRRQWRRQREKERVQEGRITTGKRSREMQLTPYIGRQRTPSFTSAADGYEPQAKRRYIAMELD